MSKKVSKMPPLHEKGTPYDNAGAEAGRLYCLVRIGQYVSQINPNSKELATMQDVLAAKGQCVTETSQMIFNSFVHFSDTIVYYANQQEAWKQMIGHGYYLAISQLTMLMGHIDQALYAAKSPIVVSQRDYDKAMLAVLKKNQAKVETPAGLFFDGLERRQTISSVVNRIPLVMTGSKALKPFTDEKLYHACMGEGESIPEGLTNSQFIFSQEYKKKTIPYLRSKGFSGMQTVQQLMPDIADSLINSLCKTLHINKVLFSADGFDKVTYGELAENGSLIYQRKIQPTEAQIAAELAQDEKCKRPVAILVDENKAHVEDMYALALDNIEKDMAYIEDGTLKRKFESLAVSAVRKIYASKELMGIMGAYINLPELSLMIAPESSTTYYIQKYNKYVEIIMDKLNLLGVRSYYDTVFEHVAKYGDEKLYPSARSIRTARLYCEKHPNMYGDEFTEILAKMCGE